MSANNAFILVNERGWRRGLSGMFRTELSRWWRTRMWWVQCLIWMGIVGFMVGAVLFTGSIRPPAIELAVIFAVFGGLSPAIGVLIIMQDAVVGEKRSGTAAWVLSKPVTRPAFLLSKVIANSLGVLVTMVILPGCLAFGLQAIGLEKGWNLQGFPAALGVVFLSIFFFLSLALMLGTFFDSRGPVIGIGLALLLFQQYLIGLLPFLRYLLPWNLLIPLGQQMNAAIPCLLVGSQNYSTTLIGLVALESVLFLLVGLWRFNGEEL